MTQFVFIHEDKLGNVWKHVHFSHIKALKALKEWQEMKEVVLYISTRIREMPRDVVQPCILGRTIQTTILIEE